MEKYRDQVFAAIGQYVVTSILVAWFLIAKVDTVPFWMTFPLTTIWMVINGTFSIKRSHRK